MRALSAAVLVLFSAGVAVAVVPQLPPPATPAETIPPLAITWEAADPSKGADEVAAWEQATTDARIALWLETAERAAAARRRAARSRAPRSAAAILACENRTGDYRAENPTSTASGRYQFVDGTFRATKAAQAGGWTHAADAPPEVQDAAFAEVWDDGRGSHHWRECGG